MMSRIPQHENGMYENAPYIYDPSNPYYIIPNPHHNPAIYSYYDPIYYNGQSSPMVVKYKRKKTKEGGITQYYSPFYGIAPLGTCPG